jgi:hypothetical protein
VGLADREGDLARARTQPLPEGPTAWPVPPEAEEPEAEADTTPDTSSGTAAAPSATSDEGGVLPADGR